MGGTLNKHESKYVNTARLMDEALLGLLAKKDFDYITITEVCKKAGVNRSTFYLHYEGMYELLAEALEYNMRSFFDIFSENCLPVPEVKTSDIERLKFIQPNYLLPYLNYIKDNNICYLHIFGLCYTILTEEERDF